MHADAPEEKSIPLDILKEAMATIIVRGEHYGDSDSNLQFIKDNLL